MWTYCFKVVGLTVNELGVMCQETFSEIYRLVKKKKPSQASGRNITLSEGSKFW